MAEQKNMSIAELCRVLVDEFAVALVMVKRSHPNVRVRSVTLGIGQGEEDFAASENSEDIGNTPLLADRYPGSEKGWQLKLELGERTAASFAGVERPLPARTAATVLDLVADQPLSAIDGISTSWARFFAEFEITELIHLARLTDAQLQELIKASNSLRVREFRQKVLLLRLPLPGLPPSRFGDTSLDEVLRLPSQTLQESFPRTVTRDEVDSLFEVLDMLNLVIDNRLLRRFNLQELLDG